MEPADLTLARAGVDLAEEIRAGDWKHVTELKSKPAPACGELIDELCKRCPGFSNADYRQAIAHGLWVSR